MREYMHHRCIPLCVRTCGGRRHHQCESSVERNSPFETKLKSCVCNNRAFAAIDDIKCTHAYTEKPMPPRHRSKLAREYELNRKLRTKIVNESSCKAMMLRVKAQKAFFKIIFGSCNVIYCTLLTYITDGG